MTERIVDRAALPSTSPRAPLAKGEHGVLAKGRLPADSLLSFRPKRSFLPSTRAKPWLLRERGAATKRSCKARLRGLIRAQFAATSEAEKSRSVSDGQKTIDRAKKRALTYYVKARYRCSTLLRQKNCPLCSLTGRVPRGIDPTVQHGCRQRIPVQRTGENFQPTVLPLCRRGI